MVQRFAAGFRVAVFPHLLFLCLHDEHDRPDGDGWNSQVDPIQGSVVTVQHFLLQAE
jgi:hypothetical protein